MKEETRVRDLRQKILRRIEKSRKETERLLVMIDNYEDEKDLERYAKQLSYSQKLRGED